MDRRSAPEAVAQSLSSRLAAAGETPATLAAATDIGLPAAHAILSGARDMSVAELALVGGFLHINPASLLEGVAA